MTSRYQNASPMYMPPAKVSGKWLISRSAADQIQVLDLAKAYFSSEERDLLEQLIGTKDLKYDEEEVQILKNRGVGTVLTGITVEEDKKPGPPLLQFYDYVMTIDQVKNIMRGLYVHLNNTDTVTPAIFKQLETVVHYPDGVPAEQRDAILEGETRHPGVEGYKREYYSIFTSRMAIWTNDGQSSNIAATIQDKTMYTRSWDETYFLRSPICNAMQALSQGLFLVFECTDAPYLNVNGMSSVANNEEKIRIPQQSWINAFEKNKVDSKEVRDANVIAESPVDVHHYKRVQRLITEQDKQQGLDAGALSTETLDVDNITILQAKPLEVDAYSLNPNGQLHIPYFQTNNVMASEAEKLVKIAENVYFKRVPTGGAIGQYIIDKYGQQLVPANGRVVEVKINDIFKQMGKLSNHPIHACQRLALAYQRSGMQKHIIEMMMYLQRALEAASRNIYAKGQASAFGVANLNEISKAGVVPRCAKGLVPRYYQETVGGDGKTIFQVVPEEQAFVARDGKMELASNVSRTKYDCVSRVSISDVKSSDVENAFKYFPMMTPASQRPAPPELTGEVHSIEQIQDKVKRVGGFTDSSEPMSKIYGVGANEMRAYVVGANLMSDK